MRGNNKVKHFQYNPTRYYKKLEVLPVWQQDVINAEARAKTNLIRGQHDKRGGKKMRRREVFKN